MTQSILDTLAGTTNGTASATVTVTPLPKAPEAHGITVIPYDARLDSEADAFLAWMWHRMQKDDLVDYYFPGQKDTGFATFVRLFSGDAQVALFVNERESKQWEDRVLGFITWTPMLMGASNAIIAGFIFFRKWQDHHTTDEAAVAAFKHWFGQTGTKIVLGVCPATHVAAMRYNRRVGLKEVGRIPMIHTHQGKACDAVLFAMTRDEWIGGH